MISKCWFVTALLELPSTCTCFLKLKYTKKSLLLPLLLLSACSLEKELPLPCGDTDQWTAKQLCNKYRQGSLDLDDRNELLLRYGFNKRDAQSIISNTGQDKGRCRLAVGKQCDLISLRNGVGY